MGSSVSISTAEAGSSVFMVVGTNMFKLEKRMNLITTTAKQNADEKSVLTAMVVAHLTLGTLGTLGTWHLALGKLGPRLD